MMITLTTKSSSYLRKAQASKEFLHCLWDSSTGGFRFASHQPATLMATAYGVLGLEFVDGLSQLTIAQKEAIVTFLMAGAQSNGSFVDPLFRHEDILSKEHDLSYFQEETTTFCQQALDALQASPPPPRQWSGWDNADCLIQYFDSILWENPWLDSNRVMFALSQLCHDSDRHQKPELLKVIHAALDWLDDHQNPETGLWQGSHEVSLTNAMAATFHFTFYYGFLGRPLKFVDRIIDSCLALQEVHGLFSGKTAVGQTCLDYDALDLLAKATLVSDYRSEDVQKAMQQAYYSLLKLYNAHDGGFANCKEYSKLAIIGRKAKLMRKVGLSKFVKTEVRVPAKGMYSVCWHPLSCDIAQSNSFSTWFRLLGLRLATQSQWLDTHSEKDFTFRRLPFLGYHDPAVVQAGIGSKVLEAV
jgi:hypothetical protein